MTILPVLLLRVDFRPAPCHVQFLDARSIELLTRRLICTPTSFFRRAPVMRRCSEGCGKTPIRLPSFPLRKALRPPGTSSSGMRSLRALKWRPALMWGTRTRLKVGSFSLRSCHPATGERGQAEVRRNEAEKRGGGLRRKGRKGEGRKEDQEEMA